MTQTPNVREAGGYDARSASQVGAAGVELDELDAAILSVLAIDGRVTNSALAQRVGVAASTCLNRVRELRERGVIRGFAADIDPVALGHPIQAMISVKMNTHARGQLEAFMDEVLDLPGVLNAYLLGGSSDYLIHVAAPTVHDLRDLVIEALSGNPDVAATETSLIFRYARATRVPVTTLRS